MTEYEVLITQTVGYTVSVMAESEEQAEELAEQTDDGEWTRVYCETVSYQATEQTGEQ